MPGTALAPLEVQEPKAALQNHLVSAMPPCNPVTPVQGALSCRVEDNTPREERQMLSIRDAVTVCVLLHILEGEFPPSFTGMNSLSLNKGRILVVRMVPFHP